MVKLMLCRTAQDVDAGIKALVEVFEEKHTYYKKWCDEKREDLLSGKRELFRIINEDNDIVGYVMLNYVSDKYVKLNAIAVDKKFQKRGYARDAFKFVFDMLKALQYEYLFIQTRHYNATVLHMFESMGFAVIGEKFHELEQMNNVVACYSLNSKQDFKEEAVKIASEIYDGFTPV